MVNLCSENVKERTYFKSKLIQFKGWELLTSNVKFCSKSCTCIKACMLSTQVIQTWPNWNFKIASIQGRFMIPESVKLPSNNCKKYSGPKTLCIRVFSSCWSNSKIRQETLSLWLTLTVWLMISAKRQKKPWSKLFKNTWSKMIVFVWSNMATKITLTLCSHSSKSKKMCNNSKISFSSWSKKVRIVKMIDKN
jgi:hypothetical protein